MPAPKNLWRPKNRPKFFVIFDNFRLWSRISREMINISKIRKALDHRQPLPRYRRKNLAYFGPQTKKLLTLIKYTLMHFFSGDYISACRRCLAMKFLYALEIDKGYLAHTPTGTGVPKTFYSWKLKIWPKIQPIRLNNFRASGSTGILMGLFQPTCRAYLFFYFVICI